MSSTQPERRLDLSDLAPALVTDFLGTCTSTIILALRTIAVWHQDKRIAAPLGVLCLGQIVLWTQTMRYSKSIWNPQRKVCQILSTSPVPLLIGVWSYSELHAGRRVRRTLTNRTSSDDAGLHHHGTLCHPTLESTN